MPEIKKLDYVSGTHSHGRIPGQEHKQTLFSLGEQAVAGGELLMGVMPNDNPEYVLTEKILDRKIDIFKPGIMVDTMFYFGTDGHNISEFPKALTKTKALKVFLLPSTDAAGVDDPVLLDSIFENWPELIAVHAEEDKVPVALDLAAKWGRRLHILHVSRPGEAEDIRQAKRSGVQVTAETCPQYLLKYMDKARSSDPRFQMNPELNSLDEKEAILEAVKDGTIDVLGTDHAPHALAEKFSSKPPRGIPGLVPFVPLMLQYFQEHGLSDDLFNAMINRNHQRIFGLNPIPDSWIEVEQVDHLLHASKFSTIGWSPYDGLPVRHRISKVFRRNELVFDGERVLAKPGSGEIILP